MNKELKIHVYPVKDYFIRTITKDVELEDCVLDLLDNCIDGANRAISKKKLEGPLSEEGYKGFRALINFDSTGFVIEDNCGGIPLDYAIDYAFYFGRRPDAPEDLDQKIGLYGIGMKRAIFKLGERIDILTSTRDEAYRVPIDVPEWAKNPDDWDFELEESDVWQEPGTRIEITNLKKEVMREFELTPFMTKLVRMIARDYSFFLQKGFEVIVNNNKVIPFEFKLRQSDDFMPINIEYQDEIEEDVLISITAGMADVPLEDDSAEATQQIREADYYGWFVSCNDRIVLAGDKSKETVWGDNEFTYWHPQYYGFMGIVNFHSSNPSKLPWTTTKRDLDSGSSLYRRAVARMKEATRPYITYTGARKANLEKAKEMEQKAAAKPISELDKSEKMVVPELEKSLIVMTTIQYRKPESLVRKVAESLGNRSIFNKDVGIKTFDYYVDNELED